MHSALALALSVTIAAPSPSVSSISLKDLVRHADVVVVARVERVHILARSEASTWIPKEDGDGYDFDEPWVEHRNELPVASISVERVLEGPADLKSARFLATGTWTCDITGAKPGDRGLFFLEEDRFESTLPGFIGSIRAAVDGAPFYRVMHAGRGAMPYVGDPALERVKCWDDVVLPDALVQASGHEELYTFIHHVPLDLLEKQVRTHVSNQLPFVRVIAPSRGKTAAWSLSIWGDGVADAWIDREENAWPPIAPSLQAARDVMERIESSRFFELPDALGAPTTAASSIALEVHSATSRKRVVIGDLGSAPIAPNGDLQRALRIYAGLRALLDDPGASDDRARIRDLLNQAR